MEAVFYLKLKNQNLKMAEEMLSEIRKHFVDFMGKYGYQSATVWSKGSSRALVPSFQSRSRP